MSTPSAQALASSRVVIVGAGPVGLLLAGDLALAGIRTLVFEQRKFPMTESRASQLTTLTAELLHERGCHALLAEATHEPHAHFAGIGVDLGSLDSDFAGNWKVAQFRVEAALADRAEQCGAQVVRGVEVVDLTNYAEHAAVGICLVNGQHASVDASYVVGCDGARSTVRRLGRFPVAAWPATRELLRADVTGLAIRDRRFERLPAGFAVAHTRSGITRVMVHERARRLACRSGPATFADVVEAWLQVTGERIGTGTVAWVDRFDNARGRATQYQHGRMLLAGDAAHWHLPIGGQSLNIGLQDAAELGWRLAEALRGDPPSTALEGYQRARCPVAARTLDWVTAQEILLLDGPSTDPLHALLNELATLPQVQAHLAGVVSNLDTGMRETRQENVPNAFT